MICGIWGVYTSVTWVSDVWLFEAFARKGFFASFSLTDTLLTSILLSLFFSFFFCKCPCGCTSWSGFCGLYRWSTIFWVPYLHYISVWYSMIWNFIFYNSVLKLFRNSNLQRLLKACCVILVGDVLSVIVVNSSCFNR